MSTPYVSADAPARSPAARSELTLLGAAEIAARVRRGDLSALEVVDAHIARIEAVNPQINALVVPLFEEARQAARTADARRGTVAPGPLAGVPVTVKECFNVWGTPATVGVPARKRSLAAEDAALVTRLRDAGAIVLGKTNVSQFLFFVETDNPVYGRTNNPWDLERSPGGSSGGEAAIVAAGGSALGLGTDIGGSIRVPAHVTGIFGLKPTPGRVSLQGSVNETMSAGNEGIADAAGPLARNVADLNLAMQVLAANDHPSTDPLYVPMPWASSEAVSLRELRIGYYEDDGYFPASPALRRAVRESVDMLRDAGAHVESFAPPEVDTIAKLGWRLFAPDRFAKLRQMAEGGPLDPRIADIFLLTGMPNWQRPFLARLLAMQGKRRLAALLPHAGLLTSRQFLDVLQARRSFQTRFAAALAEARLDALLCPPNALPALTHGATRDLGVASVNYTFLFNLLGYPAGVAPITRVRPDEESSRPPSKDPVDAAARLVDRGSAGLPVGVQVVARPWREDVVLAIMGALEVRARPLADYPAQPPL